MGGLTKQERERRDKLAGQGIKVCGKCRGEKPFEEFSNDKSRKGGLQNKCKECKKAWREANKDKMSALQKAWYEANREKLKARKRERKATDPLFKLSCNLRSLIKAAYKNGGFKKNSKTRDIAGCSFEQFSLWINLNEGQHIDHVIPVSLGRTEEEMTLLNHYSNLQALDAEENIRKGNRYIRTHNLERVLSHHPQPELIEEIINRSDIEII